MARLRPTVTAGPVELPEELTRFRFADWHRLGDLNGLEASMATDAVKAGTEEERRWSFLAVRAYRRFVKARDARLQGSHARST